ncbi:MAG TPA: hypothetical protein ENG42_01640 [Candidatus Aenigmarchaeota archaeon]|nr:MAG: hypothetical protein DRP03_01070 [Candidatus Aenigmarchaeota archaeon]HDD46152.1 hypothetical protein [Candidatus Aenigmarchaeota archaeon]
MDKKDIVKLFLKNKMLISPRLLDTIKNGDVERIINTYKSMGVLVADVENEPKKDIVIKKLGIEKAKIGVSDIVKHNQKKYNILRDILLKKVNAISINNLQVTRGDVWIVGMVSEREGNLIVEDMSGNISLALDEDRKKDIETGDIIALNGFYSNGRFVVKNIAWPDVSIEKRKEVIEDKINLNKIGEGVSIIVGEKSKIEKDVVNISKDDTPLYIFIGIREKGCSILVHKANMNKEECLSVLKKRQIKYKGGILSLALDKKPDIFWIINKDDWTLNYKGIIIVSLKEDSSAVIDIKNGNVRINQ